MLKIYFSIFTLYQIINISLTYPLNIATNYKTLELAAGILFALYKRYTATTKET